MLVNIPTLNDEPSDFDYLFQMWDQLKGDNLEVTFDFTGCRFLRQNAVAFIGGLANLVHHRNGRVNWNWESIDPSVAENLAQKGFQFSFGEWRIVSPKNSIPYRQDTILDDQEIMTYLKRKWIGRGWINISPRLRDAIAGHVWETYINVFDHAESTIGIFSCGQYYPNMNLLKLTVVDFGVGIPASVRWYFRQDPRGEKLTAAQCLNWAFRAGTSTKPGGRGIGLDLLKAFVQLNHGKLEVYSHEGYALVSHNEERYANRSAYFEGTLVNITFICDARRYCLTSEAKHEPLF